MEITFIGLGTMGSGMVRNLLGAGHTVTVWNRSSHALPGELARVRPAATLAEAVAGARWIMVCVTGPAAQREIFLGENGLLAHLGPGATIADATTTDPSCRWNWPRPWRPRAPATWTPRCSAARARRGTAGWISSAAGRKRPTTG